MPARVVQTNPCPVPPRRPVALARARAGLQVADATPVAARVAAAPDGSASELAELNQCTFHPATNRGHVVEAEGPVIVRGLGRYLELKELAKRQADEKKHREERAFALKYSARQHTVPEPFNLTQTQGDARKAKLREDLANREMRECTFQPQTLESANRALIERLLDE